MWKKFFISIVSIALVGGASIVSSRLFAASDPSIQIVQKEEKAQYINDTVSFVVSSLSPDEHVQYIEGGSVEGNKESYTIPLIEQSDVFEVSGLAKPGAYQGHVKASVQGIHGIRDVEESFTFTLYGKVFDAEEIDVQIQEQKKLVTYGTLPSTLTNPTYVYTSANSSIVEVDEEGILTAKKQGDTQVTLEIYDKDTRLSSSVCQVHVLDKPIASFKYETAIQGEEHGYRFIPQHTAEKQISNKQSVGFFQLEQSGKHTYYFEDDAKELLEVVDGYLYVQDTLEEKEFSTTVYILHEDSGKLYRVFVTISLQEKEEEPTPFSFRYNGNDVKSIIRPYQYGSNSFQIASNQSIGQVSFKLKTEDDYEYLSVSQTGNVTIKKVTEHPVIVVATYHKETYELPITIEKSEQIISTKHDSLTLSIEDGAADPLILGRKGEGSLVFASEDASIADVRMHADGTSSILPMREGKTQIHIFNNGDDVYKKSNRITIQVQVIKEDVKETILQGKEDWLTIQKAQGAHGWHIEPVQISLQKQAEIIAFSYQEHWLQEVRIAENGEIALPITFKNEANEESTPIKVQLLIDTQAPQISHIEEVDAADTEVKEFLNQITFAKSFGRGKNIIITASDMLIDPTIKTSGIGKIAYRIYRIEDGNELVLAEGVEEGKERIQINVEDTGVHKVCAYAIDQAGLQGKEVCQLLTKDAPQLKAIANTGLLLRAKQDVLPTHIEVMDAMTTIQDHPSISSSQIQAAYAFVDEKKNPISIEDTIELILPIADAQTINEQGIWKQESSTGSYESIPAQYDKDTCTLSLTSLKPVIYVQGEEVKQETTSLLLPIHTENTALREDAYSKVTPIALQSFLFSSEDIHIFLYAGGAVLIGLFVIVLIRFAHEEDEYK